MGFSHCRNIFILMHGDGVGDGAGDDDEDDVD